MTNWTDGAQCRIEKAPLHWFFAETSVAQNEAFKVCDRCEVWKECGKFARQTGATGIWGGRRYT